MKRVTLHPLVAERAREALDEHARMHRAAAAAGFPGPTEWHLRQARLSETASDHITQALKKIRAATERSQEADHAS